MEGRRHPGHRGRHCHLGEHLPVAALEVPRGPDVQRGASRRGGAGPGDVPVRLGARSDRRHQQLRAGHSLLRDLAGAHRARGARLRRRLRPRPARPDARRARVRHVRRREAGPRLRGEAEPRQPDRVPQPERQGVGARRECGHRALQDPGAWQRDAPPGLRGRRALRGRRRLQPEDLGPRRGHPALQGRGRRGDLHERRATSDDGLRPEHEEDHLRGGLAGHGRAAGRAHRRGLFGPKPGTA